MNPQVRELTPDDTAALREFFAKMASEDRTFFFQDVNDPAVVDAYASDERRLRRCAVDEDGRIVALAALQPGVDWTRHVADLVLLVAPDARREGLGRALARQMLVVAGEPRVKQVAGVIAAGHRAAIAVVQTLGFQAEALLRDQLCNPDGGAMHDTVILAHLVDETWSTMLTGGFEEALR